VALQRGLRDLRDEVEEAREQVPKIPAIVDRLTAEQKHLEAEQARLERELTKTKERLSKMRVDQSIADYRLSEHLREQPAPGVELKFETASTSFAVKDLDPNAAAAWREFVAGVLDAQQDAATSMSISDTGWIIALPLRRHDAA
jgi:predicted nuclease with TOPRIM domain